MFDIGYQELFILALLAIFVIGPKELPGFLRTMGKYIRQARRQISDIQREVSKAIDTEEINSLKKDVNSLTSFDPLDDVKKDLNGTVDDIENWDSAKTDVKNEDTPEQNPRVRKFVPKSKQSDSDILDESASKSSDTAG